MPNREKDETLPFKIGVSLIVLIILYGVLVPRPGFDDILIKEKRTDSIMIFEELGHQSVTITGPKQKNAIFVQVKQSVPFSPQNVTRAHTVFTMLFFSGGKSNEVDFEDSKTNGQLIYVGAAHFRSDSLWAIARSYFVNIHRN